MINWGYPCYGIPSCGYINPYYREIYSTKRFFTYDKLFKQNMMKKEILDISMTLEEVMIIYPTIRKFEKKIVNDFSMGDNLSLSEICLSSHAGTHIDSPYHFLPNGKKLDDYDLDIFFGPVSVIQVPDYINRIDGQFLASIGNLPERILFKTRNSKLYSKKVFDPDYVYVDESGAKYIVEQNVKLVGIDYQSFEKYGSTDYKAHKIVFTKDILVLEGINLSNVNPGNYFISCFPLKIKDAEAAPARAVLIK
jgi:arylformamidase